MANDWSKGHKSLYVVQVPVTVLPAVRALLGYFCCDTGFLQGEDVRGRPRGGILLSLGGKRLDVPVSVKSNEGPRTLPHFSVVVKVGQGAGGMRLVEAVEAHAPWSSRQVASKALLGSSRAWSCCQGLAEGKASAARSASLDACPVALPALFVSGLFSGRVNLGASFWPPCPLLSLNLSTVIGTVLSCA